MTVAYESESCADSRLWRDSEGCLNKGLGLINREGLDDNGDPLLDGCVTDADDPEYDELIDEYEREAQASRGFKPIKKQVSFCLSEVTIKGLRDIARQKRVSQADVISVFIHAYTVDEWDIDSLDEWFDIARLS